MIEASGAEPAGGIAGWAAHIMETLGAPGTGLANAIDTVLPFVPSEVILPIAGFTAGQGRMSVVAAIVWATVGSVLGSLVVYYVGALLGRERTRSIAERIPLVRPHEIDRAEAWFGRHGGKTVFLARMVPVLRSLISSRSGLPGPGRPGPPGPPHAAPARRGHRPVAGADRAHAPHLAVRGRRGR
jgi:membrane protein DedA with SNARE-associated domain